MPASVRLERWVQPQHTALACQREQHFEAACLEEYTRRSLGVRDKLRRKRPPDAGLPLHQLAEEERADASANASTSVLVKQVG